MDNENKTPNFDELLKNDKEFQKEFDRRVSKSIETAVAKEHEKWAKDEADRKAEAERLAGLSAEEKMKEQLSKLTSERDNAVKKLNALELRGEAVKIAAEKGVDASMLDVIDFGNETAESVKTKIDVIASAYNKGVEEAVKKANQQKPPTYRANEVKGADKAYLDAKYGNNPFYKK